MKKIFSVIVLASFFTVLLAPVMALAQVDVTPPGDTCTMSRTITIGDITCSGQVSMTGDTAICCILNTLYNVTDVIFMILVAVAAIMVIIGAVTIVMAGGNSDGGKSRAGA